MAAEVAAAVEGEAAELEAAEMGIGFALIRGIVRSGILFPILYWCIVAFVGVVTEIGHLGVAAGI